MARRLRQVIDLYSTGQTHELRDGTLVWVQPLNPFEQDTARSEAQIARSRVSLALREEGEDEQDKVRMWFEADGIEGARERLVEAKVNEATTKIFESIRNDPDWTERLQIMDRGAEQTALPLEEPENKLLLRITNEFAAELGNRIATEREWQIGTIGELDEEALWKAYLDWFIEQRAADVMLAEFRLHQVLFGVRWCEAVKDPDTEQWNHADCNGHPDPIFTDKDQLRRAPGDLLEVLYYAADNVDMSSREAKNSHRQGSSSGSSPLPSEVEESTASTPSETPPEPPGSSSSPSDTPLPSWGGQN